MSTNKQDNDSRNDSALAESPNIVELEDEYEEDQVPYQPLTPSEFQNALSAIDVLGLTWTADRTPSVKPKTSESEEALISEAFENVQRQYPHLPFEVFLATSHFLTGNSPYAHMAGGEESLREKAEIAGRIIVDREFRTEFFFRSAIKVPYLRDIDWEIVSKLYERGVTGSPNITYGLLSLALQNPFSTGKEGSPSVRHITVAVDEKLVSNLLEVLNEVKSKLEGARCQTEGQDDNRRP